MTNKQRMEFRGGEDWKSPPKPKPKLKATKSVPVLPSGPVPRLQPRSASRARTAILQIPVCSHAQLHHDSSIDRTARITVMNNDTPSVPEPYLDPIITKSDKQSCQISVTTRIPPPRVLSRREFNREKGGKKIVRSFSDRSSSTSQQCERALPRSKPLAYLVVDLQTGRPIYTEIQAETELKAIDDRRGSDRLPRSRIKPILPPKSATMSTTGNRRPVPLPRKRSLKKTPLVPPTVTMETKDFQTEDSTKQVNERRARRESPLPLASKELKETEERSLVDRVQPSLPPTTESVCAAHDRPHPIPRRSFSKTPSPVPTSQLSNQHSTSTDPHKKHPPSPPTTVAEPEIPRERQPSINSNLKVKPARPPPPNPKALQRVKANKVTSLLRTTTSCLEVGSKNVGTQSLRFTPTSNSHAGPKTPSRSQSSGDIPSSKRAPPLTTKPRSGTLQSSHQQSRTIEPKAHPDYEDLDSDDDEEGSEVIEIPLPEVPSSPPPPLPPKPQLRGKPSFQRTNRASRETSVSSVGSLSVSSNGSLSSISEQRFEFDDDDHVYEKIDTSIPIPPPRRKKKPKSGPLPASRTRSNTISPRKVTSKAPLHPPPRSDPLKRKDLNSRTIPTSSLVTTAPSRIPSSGHSSALRKDIFSLPDEEPKNGGIVGDSRTLPTGIDRPERVWPVLEEPDVGGVDEYIDINPTPAWEQGEEIPLDMEDDHPSESYVEMHPSAERPTIAATSDPVYIEMDPSSYIPPPGLYYASKDLLAKRPDLKSEFSSKQKSN